MKPLRRPVPLLLEECLFHHGVMAFNTLRYFDAHEAWEEVWRPLPGAREGGGGGVKKRFYQAMIQAAVALEHYRRGNGAGVVRMQARYRPRFAGLPGVCMGVDLAGLLRALEGVVEPILATRPARGTFTLEAERAPRITLLYDPFATGEAAALAPPAPAGWM